MSAQYCINGHPVKFRVNMKHKKVTAAITLCQHDVVNKLANDLGVAFGENEAMLHTQYSASATCHETDVFDIDVGKKIAYRRLLKKYLACYAKRLRKLSLKLMRLEGEVSRRREKIIRHIETINPTYGVE